MASSQDNSQASNLTSASQHKVQYKPNFDDYIQCPYDSSHRLLRSRFAAHLIRCARNYTGKDMIHCPFNITHVMKPCEMPEHIKICKNRSDLDRFVYPDTLPPPDPPASKVDLVESAENWDDDPPVPTYDPNAYCEKNPVIRNISGASPAARRAFRELERKRIRQLNEAKK